MRMVYQLLHIQAQSLIRSKEKESKEERKAENENAVARTWKSPERRRERRKGRKTEENNLEKRREEGREQWRKEAKGEVGQREPWAGTLLLGTHVALSKYNS